MAGTLSLIETFVAFMATVFAMVACIGAGSDQSNKLMSLPWLKIIADNGADIYVGVRYYVDHYQGIDHTTYEVFSIQGDEGIGGCDNSADATFALCVLSVIFGFICTLMNAHRVYDLDAYESEAWEAMVIAIIGMFFSFAAFFNFFIQCYYGDAMQNYSLRYDPRIGDGLSLMLLSAIMFTASAFMQFFHQFGKSCRRGVRTFLVAIKVKAPSSEEEVVAEDKEFGGHTFQEMWAKWFGKGRGAPASEENAIEVVVA